jgi:isoleucyl-tRNA synthetase
VEKKHGRVGQKLDARAFRAACRAYATEQIDLQRKEFKRLGVLGDWDQPYITMDAKYEAQQIRALGKVIANGHLTMGAKPVHWCLDCRSALAEAEVEYEDKTSPAIDVAFRLVDVEDFARRSGVPRNNAVPTSVVIWTTTPWTLPANEAVALRAQFVYLLLEIQRGTQRERILLAEGLEQACLARYGVAEGEAREVARMEGRALEGLLLRHPFQPRQVPIILGDHVTLEAGTGAVHTAPAHGQDDYIVGRRYNLPVVNPVLGDGRFQADVPLIGGMKLDDASKLLIETMEASGHLLHHARLTHSYPHCWRHKSPVIFRATPQWFISMEQNGLRHNALRDIRKVKWIPDWGQQRIAGMIETRPDWCISRQRTWGVPIALFVHKETDKLHPRTSELIEVVAQRIEVGGIDAWFDLDARELLGDDAESYRKVTDVMDVWTDSGVSFECVGTQHPEMSAPVEMYLEGSDQHRGWFHSALLMSEALYERAPYKSVLTHGFVVDDKGRKMSKSLGNVVAPDKVMNSLGADVLRLWVAATNYTSEMSCSDEILKRTSDSYRRIRNTVRFLLGNLHGFEPVAHAVAVDQLIALDAWALQRAATLQVEVIAAYRDYQFHLVYQKVHNFCVNDLGGLYLDILKDRLYTTPNEAHTRRSAQTAMFHIVHAMVRWLAPVLSFTAEEIWKALPGQGGAPMSVFLARWHDIPAVPTTPIDWPALNALRYGVQRTLEVMREVGQIGSSLDAEVQVYCTAAEYERYSGLGEELKFFLITSAATVTSVTSAPAHGHPVIVGPGAVKDVWYSARRSPFNKCTRCWHLVEDVGTNADHPELCSRCAGNVMGLAEVRRYV